MSQLMNLSKAARLVGVSRVALQKKIREGLLPSFEGMVSEEGLLQVYPDIQIEDNSVFEHMGRTKERAIGARTGENLPSKEVLATRLTVLGRELADTQTELKRYRVATQELEEQLDTWSGGSGELQAAAATLKMRLHQALQTGPQDAGHPTLAIRDVFLRVMASHVRFQPSGHEFFVDGADTLLEAALHAGLAPNYGCSNGNCGKCKARVVSGEVLKVRNHDYVLSADEQASGYALMCSNTAVSDVVIEAPETNTASEIPLQQVTAYVKGIDAMGDDMMILRLQTEPDRRLRFLAGQTVVLKFGHSLSVEYPVAGCPCDDRNLPIHIHRMPGNHVADYVATKLKIGEAVLVEGPRGDFILHAKASRPLIFVAVDRGFAALKGLMDQAIALDLWDAMHLYWIASHESDLYFPNWPLAMADALNNFRYTPVVMATDLEKATARDGAGAVLGGMLTRITEEYPNLRDVELYLAGVEILADAARRWLLEHGLPATQLHVSVVR